MIAGIAEVSGGTGICARATSAEVTCWGDADAGQLAVGAVSDYAMPTTSVMTGVSRISIGTAHVCAIAQGQVVCFGCDSFGQLGADPAAQPDLCQNSSATPVACSIAPIAVPGGANAREVSAGRTHSCAIFADERVHCWGSNADGSLGDGTTNDSIAPVLALVPGPAEDVIAAEGLSERCELVSGDFFEAVPEGADLHLLKQIVHDWDDERATRLLRNCLRALSPGGKLVLVEMVIPPDNQPSPAQAMDLNMLVMLGGRERTEAEYQRLFQGAGFRLERVIPTHSPFSVIEARRI